MTESDECYTVQEAAQLLKITPKKLRTLLDELGIEHVHLGKRVTRIPYHAVARLLGKGARKLEEIRVVKSL